MAHRAITTVTMAITVTAVTTATVITATAATTRTTRTGRTTAIPAVATTTTTRIDSRAADFSMRPGQRRAFFVSLPKSWYRDFRRNTCVDPRTDRSSFLQT